MAVRSYEGVVVLHPDTSEEQQKNLFRKNKQIIEARSGLVHHVETWGKRTMANPKGRVFRGVFFHYTFRGDGTVVDELERNFRINDRVLRFVHTQLEDVDLNKHLEDYRAGLAAS